MISGPVEGIIRINEFIMEKIKEKPDPNAKMAIDFDNKQPAEREKQVSFFLFYIICFVQPKHPFIHSLWKK